MAMGELQDFTIDQFAGAAALILGSVGGGPGTGFDGVTKPVSVQPQARFNQRIYAYVESLPRGERKKAMNALRDVVHR